MDVIAAVVLSVLAILLLVGLMALGWRNRLRRQGPLAEPAGRPAKPGVPVYAAEGQYVVTTSAGDWLDRITVHGLGVKAVATAAVYDHGLLFDRTAGPDTYIPAAALRRVRLERGMAGKFVEKDGLVVVTWELDGALLDTGFRTRYAADKAPLLAALGALIQQRDPADPADPTTKESQ